MEKGTRAVRNGILERYPDADVSISVVWISMMDSDILQAAEEGVNTLKDGRIRFFFDPNQISGKEVAKTLGHEGEIAWDMYMFFPMNTMWNKTFPEPELYMHQLDDSWADQTRLFQDLDLGKELGRTMDELFGKG